MGTPSFGIVTHAVGHDPMPFDDCLRLIAATTGEQILLLADPAGPAIRSDEAAPSHYPNLLASDPAEVLRRVSAAGLRIGGVLPFVATDVADEAATEATRAAYAPWLAAAHALGCQTFCISAPRAAGSGLPISEKADGLRRLAGLMDALVEGSPDPAAMVTVDIHYGSLVETVDDGRFLVAAMRQPRAGLLLNIGHLTTCRQEGWKLVEEHADRIHTVGWKDHSLAENRPNPVYSIELGTADSPFDRYVRAFKASGDDHAVHFVNVEHPPRGDEVPTLRRSLAYIRQLWATTD